MSDVASIADERDGVEATDWERFRAARDRYLRAVGRETSETRREPDGERDPEGAGAEGGDDGAGP